MDTAVLVVAIVGIVLSSYTVWLAFKRYRIFYLEYKAAKDEKLPGPDHAIEVQAASDLYWGQLIRLVGYSAIFVVFASIIFLVPVSPTVTRSVRIFLTLTILIAFFVEENFLIRAKNHWAQMLKERRNGGP